MGEEKDPPVRLDLWLKIASVMFGMWTVAVPIGVAVVRDSVSQLATQLQAARAIVDQHSVENAVQRQRIDELERRQRFDESRRTER